jgi:hypothetical protein
MSRGLGARGLALAAGLFALATSGLAFGAAPAVAPGLRTPARLTAGGADEFLGSLSPDGRTLYFISNRNATAQIFAQELAGGTPRLLFEEGADAAFPRVSPDGRSLAYISTRDDATGDVCVRSLPSAEGPTAVGERRCLTGAATAEALVFWYPDGHALGVVLRQGMHGDLQLRRLEVNTAVGDLGSVVVAQGVSSPALHPGGRWLVFVPVERASAAVGIAFAMRPAKGLRLIRLGGQATEVAMDLPGVTGFPACTSRNTSATPTSTGASTATTTASCFACALMRKRASPWPARYRSSSPAPAGIASTRRLPAIG